MSTENSSRLPRLALIAGPTASGKSAYALDMAEREGGTIVNADASQVYRDLRILSARPSAGDEARAPHLLYGYRDAGEACSAADWAADARAAIAAVAAAGRLPILVGGTGLYLRVLLDGIAPVPPVDADIRAAVRALPPGAAHEMLVREDARAAAILHPHDTGRAQRALEVVRSTGRSVLDWRQERVGGIAGHYAVTGLVIDPPRPLLYARCDRRVEAMMAGGAVEEVKRLLARALDPGLPVMRAIGVPQIRAALESGSSMAAAVAAMQQATRNYAKRQQTWLRSQSPPSWFKVNG